MDFMGVLYHFTLRIEISSGLDTGSGSPQHFSVVCGISTDWDGPTIQGHTFLWDAGCLPLLPIRGRVRAGLHQKTSSSPLGQG